MGEPHAHAMNVSRERPATGIAPNVPATLVGALTTASADAGMFIEGGGLRG